MLLLFLLLLRGCVNMRGCVVVVIERGWVFVTCAAARS